MSDVYIYKQVLQCAHWNATALFSAGAVPHLAANPSGALRAILCSVLTKCIHLKHISNGCVIEHVPAIKTTTISSLLFCQGDSSNWCRGSHWSSPAALSGARPSAGFGVQHSPLTTTGQSTCNWSAKLRLYTIFKISWIICLFGQHSNVINPNQPCLL